MGQAVVPVTREVPEEQEQEPVVPSNPATVAVVVEPVLLHDFAASPLACVPVGLRLEAKEAEAVAAHGRGRRGEELEGGVLVEYQLGGQTRGVRVAGSTSGRGWVARGGPTLHLRLGLAVSRPGLYTVSSWTFRARRTVSWPPPCLTLFLLCLHLNLLQADPGLEPSWTTEEVFQPVEISFEVRQKSCD
jgi:hypothetical protein